MNKPRPTLAIWLATGLGIGLVSKAPGTVGALWGLPLYAAVATAPGVGLQLALVVGLALVAIPLSDAAARDMVRLGYVPDGKDPQAIVCDEYLTVPLVFAFAPVAWGNPWWIGLGFVLHRAFDITKPWPCRRLERLGGGLGITADDIAAALYAGVSYAIAWRWLGTTNL